VNDFLAFERAVGKASPDSRDLTLNDAPNSFFWHTARSRRVVAGMTWA